MANEQCEYCNNILTDEYLDREKYYSDQICMCEVVNKIQILEDRLKELDNKILDLINEKTDDNNFSEVVRSDLEDLREDIKYKNIKEALK